MISSKSSSLMKEVDNGSSSSLPRLIQTGPGDHFSRGRIEYKYCLSVLRTSGLSRTQESISLKDSGV